MQGMSKGIADLLCRNTRAEKFTKGNWIEKALTGSNGVERFLTLVKRFKDWFCETICLECLNGSMKMEKLFQKKTLKNSTKCQLTSSEISGDQSKKTCKLNDNSWPYLDLVFTNRRSRWKWQAGYWSFCHILVRYPPISLSLRQFNDVQGFKIKDDLVATRDENEEEEPKRTEVYFCF